LVIRSKAISQAGEALRQFGPKCEALSDRQDCIDRSEGADMFSLHLSSDALGQHQADLKTVPLPPEADEHL
jgi:hypothetical protein